MAGRGAGLSVLILHYFPEGSRRCRAKNEESPQFFAPSLAQLRKSSYLCTANENKSFSAWALSSAGSERLPYKQRVGGSNPSAPTFFQTAIHRKMGSCFFVHERNGGRVGDTRKFGGRLCAKPASTGRAVVCFAWNVGRMQFLLRACLRCCRRCLGAPPRETDRWVALFSEKAERKREKAGEVEHFSPVFYPTFRTTVYSSLCQTRSSGKGSE